MKDLRKYNQLPANSKPMESAAERQAGMLENLVKPMNSNGLPRRATRERSEAGQSFPKSFENIVKPTLLTNPASQQMQWGPAGAPSALRGPESAAKAHVENHWKTKENQGSREVPLGYLRGRPAPHQRGMIPGHSFPKVIQNSGKQTFLRNPATQQIQWGRAGSRARYADPTPLQRRMAKTLGKTKAYEGSPDVFQITVGFPGTSITP